MLASIYPLFTEAVLDEAVAELDSSLDYADARAVRFRSSWRFLVPGTDTRDTETVIHDAWTHNP